MNLLVVITSPDSGPIVEGLAAACARARVSFSCFVTGDGVRALEGSSLISALEVAAEAIACEHSWASMNGASDCPISLGSQTDHSRLIGASERVISL